MGINVRNNYATKLTITSITAFYFLFFYFLAFCIRCVIWTAIKRRRWWCFGRRRSYIDLDGRAPACVRGPSWTPWCVDSENSAAFVASRWFHRYQTLQRHSPERPDCPHIITADVRLARASGRTPTVPERYHRGLGSTPNIVSGNMIWD